MTNVLETQPAERLEVEVQPDGQVGARFDSAPLLDRAGAALS